MLCVKDYDFVVLNTPFLVHRPGIKRGTTANPKRVEAQQENVKNVIGPELKRIFGEDNRCRMGPSGADF